jgi:hypothetical protein
MKRYWMFKGARMLVLFAGFLLLASVAVMLLWNALIPAIFGGARITLIQALGLLVLARILVGGRGGGFGRYRGTQWRKRWEAKLAAMTPEERKKWKEEMAGPMCWSRTDNRDPSPGVEETSNAGPLGAKTEA